jgi:peptide/nickel transport system substrate-binding protein
MNEEQRKKKLAEGIKMELDRRAFLKGVGTTGLALAGASLLPTGMDFIRPSRALAQAAGKRGGTIKVAWLVSVDFLDPHLTSVTGGIQLAGNLYNGLLKITFDGKRVSFKPDLAETWEMPNDKTHVFRLHKGVKFHDGSDFDAEIVKWNLERVKNKETGSPHAWKLALLDKIDILDKYTVRLNYQKPYAFFPVAMNGTTGRAGTMVSRKAVEKYGKALARNPVGTGPFKFLEWVENDHITMVRFPDYFEKGLPYLDRVDVKLMTEASSAVAAIITGEIDGIDYIPFQFAKQLRANAKLNVYTQVGGNYIFIGMNCARAPFNDTKLRQAVSFCIDRKAFIDQILFGEGIPAHGPISPPMTDFYEPEFDQGKNGQYFDLEKAKALIKQSKYPNGLEVEYTAAATYTGEVAGAQRNAELFQGMLAKIGVKAKIKPYERAAYRKALIDGNFDMFDYFWAFDLDPDETIYPELHSGESWNWGKWSNPEFDKLVEAAQVNLDVKKRREWYHRANRIVAEDAPYALVAHVNEHKVFAKYVKNFNPIPADLVNLGDVWIDKG